MIEERVQTALQEKLPVLPDELSERINCRLMNLTKGTKQPIKRRLIPGIACAVLLLLGIATALAATNDAINAWLYEKWPELALSLKPVNMTSISNGIEMEVISTAIEGQKALVMFSMKDLEGNRIKEHTAVTMDLDYHGNTGWKDGEAASCYDEEQRKLTVSEYYDFHVLPSTLDDSMIAEVSCLQSWTNTEVDVLPLLLENGSTTKEIEAPRDAWTESGRNPGPVLDRKSTDEMAIPIGSGQYVFLTGIGFVNGKIHVQYHVVGNTRVTARYRQMQYSYAPVDVHVELPNGEQPAFSDSERIIWGRTADGPDHDYWEEYVFTPNQELSEITALVIRVTEFEAPVFGNWRVEIPRSVIQ